MLRRSALKWSWALAALVAAGPATAAQIKFTGDSEKDFPAGQPGIGVAVDNPIKNTSVSDWRDVSQADWITDQNQVTGWNIEDLRLHYDAQSDNLYVGVNFFGVAGDADGNGMPGGTDPRTLQARGIDVPHLGGRESIAVAFDLNN